MRALIRVAIFFYVFIITVIGISVLLLLAHVADLRGFQQFLAYLYADSKAATIAGFVVATTMLISFALAQIIYGRQAQERIITLDNPLGRVTISLSALEDLVRRMAGAMPQIKEIRPSIVSSIKKGLKVDIRLILRSDVNIGELTSDLQEMIKRKIQDVIGREERVAVRIHVVKISTENLVSGKKGMDVEIESPLHSHGYRA